MRKVVGLIVAPSLGATAWVTWGYVFTSLYPTDVLPGPIWYQIRSGMPVGYALALLATWPAIFILQYRRSHSFKSFVLAAVYSRNLVRHHVESRLGFVARIRVGGLPLRNVGHGYCGDSTGASICVGLLARSSAA